MHPFRHLLVLLLGLLIALSAGCGSSGGGDGRGAGTQIGDGGSSDDGGTGGDDGGGAPSGFTLALTFKDKRGLPVQGMEVLLHEPGGAFRSVTTDAEGTASFGDIGRPQATVTWGYELVDQSGNVEFHRRSLITAVDIPSGSHVLSCPGNRSAILLNTQLLNIPSDVERVAIVFPGIAVRSPALLTNFSFSLDPQNLQPDGLISGLVLAEKASGDISSYNFILDGTPTGSTLPDIYLTESRTTSLSYAIQGGSARQVTLTLLRKGATLAPQQVGTAQSPAPASGTLTIPSAFPFEFVGLSAVQDVDGGQLRVDRFYRAEDVPEAAILTLPDFDVADIVNTISSDGRITWTIGGDTEIDMQEVILSRRTATTSTSWRWILPPEATEVHLPALSATYGAWAETGFNSLQIQLTDCDTLQSYEEYYSDSDCGMELAKCSERKTGSFQP